MPDIMLQVHVSAVSLSSYMFRTHNIDKLFRMLRNFTSNTAEKEKKTQEFMIPFCFKDTHCKLKKTFQIFGIKKIMSIC